MKNKTRQKIVLFDVDYTLFNTDIFKESSLETYELYEEVIETIEELGKIAKLGIFSEGDLDFQKMKLVRTDIHKHFGQEDIHIVEKKNDTLVKVLERYRDVELFLVDDRLGVLYEAKKHMPGVFTIWVKRGRYAQNQKEIKKFSPDATVENLRDVFSLVKNS